MLAERTTFVAEDNIVSTAVGIAVVAGIVSMPVTAHRLAQQVVAIAGSSQVSVTSCSRTPNQTRLATALATDFATRVELPLVTHSFSFN